jgi:hypothetical protein
MRNTVRFNQEQAKTMIQKMDDNEQLQVVHNQRTDYPAGAEYEVRTGMFHHCRCGSWILGANCSA